MRWIRLHTTLLTCAKYQRLPDKLKARLVNLWCLSAEHNGRLPVFDEVAFNLRLGDDETRETLQALTEARFLVDDSGVLRPKDWEEHQPQYASSSTERVRKHRAKQRVSPIATHETPAKRDETVSPVPNETSGTQGNALDRQIDRQIDNKSSLPPLEVQVENLFEPGGDPNDIRPEWEICLEEVATAIHRRHPQHRRNLTIEKLQEKLATIARKKGVTKRTEMLLQIDKNHTAACQSAQWRKNGGEFVNALSNWLAPKDTLYAVAPQPEQEPPEPEEFKATWRTQA